MGVFDEKGEKALQKAYEREDVREAMQNIIEDIMPNISIIISAALEEMNKDSEGNEEVKRSDMNDG